MANNKVIYGNTTIMDITDTTAEASDVAAGEVFYNRAGERSVGTGNYMDKVANPTAGNILTTDANGQAQDSGQALSGVALKSELPVQATDSTLGTVKLNPSESVTLNANGQLDVGGRLGAFPGTTGIFHSKDRDPRMVSDFSFLITDAKGMNLAGPRNLALATGVNLSLKSSHAAGSTTYQVSNTYANRIACYALKNGGYVGQNEQWCKENQIVAVTSVTIGGNANWTPDSNANDSSQNIVITTEASANPDSAASQLRVFGGITGGYCSVYVGQCVGGAAGASLIIGQRVYNSGNKNANCVVGADIWNDGNGSAIFGRLHINKKNRWFIAGSGHDTTNGKSEAGAVFGEYANITANTAFAVGNGTSQTSRSNLFEVTADGGIIVPSTSGNKKFKITVDDNGVISAVQV